MNAFVAIRNMVGAFPSGSVPRRSKGKSITIRLMLVCRAIALLAIGALAMHGFLQLATRAEVETVAIIYSESICCVPCTELPAEKEQIEWDRETDVLVLRAQ